MQTSLTLIEQLKKARGAADLDEDLAKRVQKLELENHQLQEKLNKGSDSENGKQILFH